MGSEAESFSNRIEVELDNDDGVYAAVNGLGAGATNSTTGQIWYGGPASVIEITAVPVLYSGGSAASLTLTDFCDAAASTASAAPFTFSPKCKGTSETDGDNPGETPAFNIAGTVVGVLNDDTFPLYLDFDAPSAPTFYPNPNDREGGWVNLTVDFLGEQKPGNKDGWLNYNSDDAGVGGYQPVLRYAEVPSSGDGLEEALAAPILTPANLPGESKADAYCAVVSAVDLLGNESKPLDPDAAACMMADALEDLAMEMEDDSQTTDVDESKAAMYRSAMRAGVDITPPVVEFTGVSLAADTTTLSTAADWVIHVTDRIGVIHSDPLDVGISRRAAKTTKKLAQQGPAADGTTSHADSFRVVPTAPRYEVDVGVAGVGYHTFTASAKDKAGNVSGSISRVALNDPTSDESIPESRLFLVPGDDIFTYAKTLVMTDNLSIKSYSAVLPLTDVGQLILKTVSVDEYNAASLTTSRTVQETVTLPYLAIQAGTTDPPAWLDEFKVSVSDQAGTPSDGTDGTDDLSEPATADIPLVTGFRSSGAGVFTVGFKEDRDSDDPVEITARAEMMDNNLDSPFSRVDFYGRTGMTDDADLKFLGSVDTSAATTELVDSPVVGRDWSYELEVSAEDYEEIVGDGNSNIVALGVSTAKGGSVAVSAVDDTDLDIDGTSQ